MEIDGRAVGPGKTPYFIAEAGVNHNGDLDLAEQLIDAAADAGADAVKFQTFSADRLVTTDAETADYQKETTSEESQYEMLRRYELDKSAHERLMNYCAARDISFLSTPFDLESADMLSDLGVPAIKVGSGELDNHPLLEHIASLGLPMIVSTGMGTMEEVIQAYEAIRSVDSDINLIFLHCTSAYPAQVEDVNLRAMQTMDEQLRVPVGYSDHTTLPETPALAVAAGACVLEKHFTIDSSLPGPDHEASLEPGELQRAINLVEVSSRALGNPEKKPTEEELKNIRTFRKGLHATDDIPPGTLLKEKHIEITRPANGLSPDRYNTVLGKMTTQEINKGDPIVSSKLDFNPKND